MKAKTTIANVLLWIFTGFCILCALAYLPSLASLLFLFIAVASMPIKPIRKIWEKIPRFSKLIQGISLTVLFFVACNAATSSDSTIYEDVNDASTVIESTVEEVSTQEKAEQEAQNEQKTTEDTKEIIVLESKEETSESKTEETSQAEEAAETVVLTPEEVARIEDFDFSSIPSYSGNPYVAVNGNVPYFTDDEMSTNSYEYYTSLDNKERCGVCVASVGTDIMPTEERGEIGSVKPSGWNQAKYAGLVDGNYLYNRCHLIGYQLTGENANIENLITGTRYLNVEGMLPFENMVADYVKETQNHVMYRVSPIFEGDNLLASGVLMEAKSVEDNGDGILFCVYCYNVQPGVEIDYSNGASKLIEEKPATNTSNEITKESQEETKQVVTETPKTEQNNTGSYAVNSKNGKIHMVGECSATGTGKNAMTSPVYFNTYEEAEVYSIQIKPSMKDEERKCKNCW